MGFDQSRANLASGFQDRGISEDRSFELADEFANKRQRAITDTNINVFNNQDEFNKIAGNELSGANKQQSVIEKRQSQSFAAQQDFFNFSRQIAEEEATRSRELFNIFKTDFLPKIQATVQSAFAGVPVEAALGAASADVQQAFQKAGDIQERQASRLGVSATSPAFQAQQRNLAIARAAAEAGARNTVRSQTRDTNFQRALAGTQIGLQFPTLARQGLQTGLGGFQAGAGGVAQAGLGIAGQQIGVQQNELNRQTQLQIAEQQRKAQEQAAIFGGLGELGGAGIGFALGGPVGAAVASQVAS